MLKIKIEEEGKNKEKGDEYQQQPREENNDATIQKKKKISILEISDFLQLKKNSKRLSWKRYSSLTTDRSDSKPYSVKCSLTNSSVNEILPDSLGSRRILNKKCPSVNIGVWSVNFDAVSGEELCEFETIAFAEIMKEATYALEVLKRTLQPNEIDEIEQQKKKPERVVVRKKGCCFEEEERKMYFGPDAGYQLVVPSVRDKLLDNREMAYNVLTKVACQLQTNGGYNWLRCEVNSIIENKEKKCSLNFSLKTWTDVAERLQVSLKEFEEEFEVQKKEYQEEIERMAQEIDASFCDNVDKLDYIKRWEESKLEQQNLRQLMEEQTILDELNELQKFRKTETKVNKELHAYLTQTINNAEVEILAWSSRYNDEMEKRQQEMTDLKEKIVEMEEFMKSSRELQESRQILIDEYLTEQQKIRDEEIYWEDVHYAAAKIQAVWRGYMVRHRLGHYRNVFDRIKVKKKKGKKGKKEKKGKKPKKK